MQPDHLFSRLGASRAFRFAALASALALAAPAARALDTVPPAFPDSAHVPNGCHLSTLSFLSKYLAQFPSESGEPLVIAMHNDAGVRWNHTVAVFSWQGQTWCRDEYFGVFALDCSFAQRPAGNRLATKVQLALDRHAQSVLHGSGANPLNPPPSDLSTEQKIQNVTAAARMVPFAAKVFWVHSGKKDIPVAFFRPNSRQIAVYEPLHGTCLAECSIRDDAKIVSLVAAKLGFHVDGVRAETVSPAATLVASSR